MPRDKLGEQTHSVGFAQAKDFLSHGVEGRGACASLLAEVRKSSGIVCEQRHSSTPDEMEKSADG